MIQTIKVQSTIKKFESVEYSYSRSTYIINFKKELMTISCSNPMKNGIRGIYGSET